MPNNNATGEIDALSILNKVPGCYLILLPDAPRFTIAGATDAYLTATYLTRAEAMGMGVFEALTDNPNYPEATGVKNLTTSLLSVLECKEAHRMADQRYDVYNPAKAAYELRIWRPTNTPVLDRSGEVQYIIHNVEDVTEQVRLQESEQEAHQKTEESDARYRSLFEAIDQGFSLVELIYDEKGRPVNHLILETNPMYEALTGLKDVVGKTALQVAPGIESQWFIMYDRAVRTGKGIRFIEESKVLNRWFDVFAYPAGGAGSKKVAVLFADISERKKAEAMLRENEALLQKMVYERTRALEAKNDELQRSNKELEEFAYAASHDLKEPIRKIHFFTERLKERLNSKLQDEDRRYFERLENGTRRMATLIDDLLLYSHVSRGIGSEEEVNLNQTLSFVLDDLELHIEEKGAIVEVAPLPIIKGHQRQLQQLFENLLGNALKYSKPEEKPLLKVNAQLVKGEDVPINLPDNKKKYHLLEVSDNGIGFDQEDAVRIFNVFTRLHGNSEYTGSGVGLSIVRKVVENHNGFIWADSKPGEGATFKILLPAE
jgi:PAS domain S-box-containing protein